MIKINDYGGFGDGSLGAVTLNSTASINSYAHIQNISGGGKTLTVNNISGTFGVGTEILFHVTTTDTTHTQSYGLYSFAHIVGINGSVYTLDNAAPVTDVTGLTCQIVSVPNYDSLTVRAQVKPLAYNASSGIGGIIVAKVKNTADFTAGGGLVTEGMSSNLAKPAGLTFADADLKTKLPMNPGNGIAIIIASTLKTDTNTRFGATWSGALGVGVGGDIGDHKGGKTNGEDGNGYHPGKSGFTPQGYMGYVWTWTNGIYGSRYAGATVLIIAQNVLNFKIDIISTGGQSGIGGNDTNGGAGYGGGGAAGGTQGGLCASGAACNNGNGGSGGRGKDDIRADGAGAGYCLICTNTALTAQYGYALDSVLVRRQVLINSKQPLNAATTGITSVEGFKISGQQPTDTNRRFLFSTDGKTYQKFTFDSTGKSSLANATTQAITVDSVLSEGNTPEELAKVTSIPDWLGKLVYPVICLDAAPEGSLPTLQLGLNVRANSEVYNHEEYSPEYVLQGSNVKAIPKIIDIKPNVTVAGAGKAVVTVAIKDASGNWSDYMDLLQAADKDAVAVKYKASYSVGAVNSADSAQVNSVTVRYTTGSTAVSGDTAEIYSITQNYEDGLCYCQALIKHKALIDSQIKAYISFRNEPKNRNMIQIGTGTGAEQTLILGVGGVKDSGINHNKLAVFVDGKQINSFSYNTETSEVTVTAKLGAAISASYEYGWEAEMWQEMTAGTVEPYNQSAGVYASRFTFTLPDSTDKKTISNIKFVLYRPSGSIKDATLGTASGSTQVYVLPHRAKAETISCNGSWSYEDESQILTVVATQGTELKISYDWIAESQEVYGYTAGWSPVSA